ncbi:alcohol dehydrogenase [Pluteus cervinus]|uniref:Alcohol dehydrogenase n=1 Tax=Pluteus cervinus TaxID=181527 RepID=A0ACD3B482_9AGAR|nr:alcohol dehydrogenase [Pluteus cervinus]
MPTPTHYKRIVLNERPVGDFEPNTFRTEVVPWNLEIKNEDEVLVQILWISLDPAMRGYVRDTRSYLPPVKIGEVMRAQCLGVVLKAGLKSKVKAGSYVTGGFGWREYAVVKDKHVDVVVPPPGTQPLDFLNTLGSSGLTAYFGLKDVGKIKPGETLVVSGAAGSVGVIVCQLGKQLGAKVYAIAGSKEKCDWLEKEIGVDGALNYKSPTFKQDFKKKIGYLDVFFDNVGGDILDFALARLNKFARVVLCGAISQYNAAKPRGLQGYLALISQRAKIEGFIVFDYEDRYAEAIGELSRGLGNGSIKRKFHIVEGGLEQAPKALPLLFNGGNSGKLVVKVADEAGVQSKL